MPDYSTPYSKFTDSDATTMTFAESIWRKRTLLLVEKVYCFLTGAAPFTIFFNYWGEAQHIGMSAIMLVERAYCFLATAAIFSIY